MTPELLQQAVKEFREIYKEEFLVDLSEQEATTKALETLQFFKQLTTVKEGVYHK